MLVFPVRCPLILLFHSAFANIYRRFSALMWASHLTDQCLYNQDKEGTDLCQCAVKSPNQGQRNWDALRKAHGGEESLYLPNTS